MKKRVIVSATERGINPLLSVVFSIFCTGLGEIYAGAPLAGIIFNLLRMLLIIAAPFYSYLNSNENMAEEIAALLAAAVITTAASPLYAFLISGRRKSIVSWYNSGVFYSIFAVLCTAVNITAILIFLSFFGIRKSGSDIQPLFRTGDIIVIKKISPAGYSRGDLASIELNSEKHLLRIIGIPGDKISYRNGRFLSEGSELPLSIFSEEELHLLSLTDYDVVSELNGRVRYPVKNDTAVRIPETDLKAGEYFLAPDIRTSAGTFIKLNSGAITGRVEGIIYSAETGLLPGGISLPGEKVFTAR